MSIMKGLVRGDWWPGLPPTIAKGRVFCSDCKHRDGAGAGWQWDHCNHPKADYGSVVVRGRATCADMRASKKQCGFDAKFFELPSFYTYYIILF